MNMTLKGDTGSSFAQRRTQEERRAETRAKLIDATIRLLHERGAVNTTTEEIAKLAGLTRGALQYHFASPNAVLKAAVVEIARRMSMHLDVAALTKLSLPARIDRIVDQYWKEFQSGTYTAFIEMAVRGRLDPELGHEIKDTLVELEKGRAVFWLEIFSDCQRSDQDLLDWRGTLLVSLRGLALTNLLARPGETVEPQIGQLKEMFKLYLCTES